MGKNLLKLVGFLLVLAIGGRWLLQWDIRNRIDQAIADMGDRVRISYERVDVGFDGKVSVKRIQIQSPDSDLFDAYIQSINVDMQSLPALIQSRLGSKAPEQMRIKLSGVNANLNQLAASLESNVSCMDPLRQPSLWMLGLDQDSDIELGYTYGAASRELTLDINLLARGAYELKTQVRLGDVAPNLRVVGSVNLLSINFDDIHTIETWRAYCARVHKLSEEQVVSAHIDAIETFLNYRGLSMPEATRAAYQGYLLDPRRLMLRWITNINLQAPPAPEVLNALLIDRMEVEVAGEPVSPIFNRIEPKRVPQPEPMRPAVAEKPQGPVEITFDQARDYIGRTVHVVTGTKTTTGVAIRVGESELVVEVIKDGTNRFSITFLRSRLDKILLEP